MSELELVQHNLSLQTDRLCRRANALVAEAQELAKMAGEFRDTGRIGGLDLQSNRVRNEATEVWAMIAAIEALREVAKQ